MNATFPGVRTPAECLRTLERLQPDEEQAQRILCDVVGDLLESLPRPERHLEVLEKARPLIDRVQRQHAGRYATRPQGDRRDDTFLRVVRLWDLLARSYALIVERAGAGMLHEQRPLVAQRRIDYAGKALLEHFGARRQVPANAWAALHDAYASAEAAQIERIRVPDPLNEVWKAQSALEAYVAVLLVDLANPYGRADRELAWVCRWAQRFAPYCDLDAHIDSEAAKPGLYGLDLASDHGLRPFGVLPQADTLRRFDGSRLGEQIRSVLGQFKRGAEPASLGLGAGCDVETSGRLLRWLYRPWGLGASGRRFVRRAAKGEALLVGDWLGIGFHVAGKRFEQPASFSPGRRDFDSDLSLLTFGERIARTGDPARAAARDDPPFDCERWTVLDQSVTGFRLQRQTPSERLEHRQLVAVRPPDSAHFLLGLVAWSMYRNGGAMEIGIQVLAGLPKVVAARPFELRVRANGAYQQAYMLPGVEALKVPPSLVLPSGWYRRYGVLDTYDEAPRQIRLADLLLQGSDFDQVSFEPVTTFVVRDVFSGSAP